MLVILDGSTADGIAACAQVRQLAAYVRERNRDRSASRLRYEAATVTRVEAVGMGDRACVDLACMMVPGEGLLAGSFARALFLVHSEVGGG